MSRRRKRSKSLLVEAVRAAVDLGRWTGHAAIRLARWSGTHIRRQARRWYRAEQAAARRRRAAERAQRAAARPKQSTRPKTPARPRTPAQRPASRVSGADLLGQLLSLPPGDSVQERLLNSRPETPAEARVWSEYIGRYQSKPRRRKKPIAVGEYAKADGTKVSSHRRATPS